MATGRPSAFWISSPPLPSALIEFDPWAADVVRGRQWHSSQHVTDLPDGGSRMTMRLSCLEEVERWILSWGTHATAALGRTSQAVKRAAFAIWPFFAILLNV